jgi:hypothetical protein
MALASQVARLAGHYFEFGRVAIVEPITVGGGVVPRVRTGGARW